MVLSLLRADSNNLPNSSSVKARRFFRASTSQFRRASPGTGFNGDLPSFGQPQAKLLNRLAVVIKSLRPQIILVTKLVDEQFNGIG